MDLYYPGALHTAATIPIITTIEPTSLSPSETARNQIQNMMLPTRPHHHQRGANHLNGRKPTWTRRGVN